MNSNDLTAMVKAVSKRYGYEDAVAQFIPIRDFKVRWTRTYKWISVEVCDYLADAPDEIIESLLTTIFKRIAGDEDAEYEEDLAAWLTADDFVREKQPMYVRRTRGLSKTPMGNLKDLDVSYRRLIEMGLVEKDPMVYLGWGIFPTPHVVARTSVIMKVVAMSDLLDRRRWTTRWWTTASTLSWSACRWASIPALGAGGAEYDALLDKYPGRYAMERKLERMDMHI